MPKTIIQIKTYVCPDCGYHQDFDPNDVDLMKLHFPEVEVGHCPACFRAENPTRTQKKVKMTKEDRPEKKTTVTIMGKEEVDILEVDDMSKEPNVKGIRPKRKLTTEEKDTLKAKIDSDIAKFQLLEDK